MSDLKQTIYLRQSSNFGPWVECEKSHPDAVAFDRRTQPEATAPAQYQVREIGEGDWRTTDKAEYERCQRYPEMDTRIVAPAQDLSAAILALPIPTHWMAHQAVVMGYMAALKDAAALASSANALSAGDRVDALAVLKSIIEDGYLSDTNTARGHAILQSQKGGSHG